MGRLAGYRYRKSEILFRTPGEITDYQRIVLVGESSGSDDPGVHCEGLCLSNFNDLRFTKSDGTTLLPYWIESITGATPNQVAKVRIKYDSIDATEKTFYMYYGNSGAAAASSGADTFPFFDDFPGVAVDGDKWPTIQGANWAVAAGVLSCTPATAGSACYVKAATALAFGYRLIAKANLPQLAGSKSASIGYWVDVNNNAFSEEYSDGTYWSYTRTVSGSVTRQNSPLAWSSGDHLIELRRDSLSLTQYLIDGVSYGTWAGGFSSDAYPIIYTYESTLTVDWFLVCKTEDEDIETGGWSAQEEFEDIYELSNISASLSGAGSVYSTSNAEEATISDVASASENYAITINESMVLIDTTTSAYVFIINESLFAWEEIINGWNVTTDENLILTDTQAIVLGLLISDWLTATDTQSNNWNGSEIVNQTLNLYDIAEKYFQISDTINESLVTTDTTTWKLTIAVLEYLGFSSLSSAMKTMASSLSESMALTDTDSYAWATIISEALAAVDVPTVQTTFVNSISESLSPADAASFIKNIGISLNDSLVVTEIVSNLGTFYTSVYDTLKMNVMVELAGEVYECYVLNTPKFMPSMYSGFDFNSYCVFENRAFGANNTGIYELTGTTDAGNTIHTGIILPETDFGSRNQKKFRRAYLGISGTTPVMVCETEDGQRQVYNIDTHGKTVISHDLKSKEWKLSIADFDELETIKLIPVILSK